MPPPRLLDAEDEARVRAWRAEDPPVKWAVVARRLGVHRRTMDRYAAGWGLAAARPRAAFVARLGLLRVMAARGWRVRRMARAVGLKPATVRRLCRRHGIRPAPVPPSIHARRTGAGLRRACGRRGGGGVLADRLSVAAHMAGWPPGLKPSEVRAVEAVEAGAADCPAVAAACGIAVRRARRVVARLVEAGHLLAVAPSRAGRPRGATLRSLSLPAAVAAARLAARNFRERYDHTFAGLRPDET